MKRCQSIFSVAKYGVRSSTTFVKRWSWKLSGAIFCGMVLSVVPSMETGVQAVPVDLQCFPQLAPTVSVYQMQPTAPTGTAEAVYMGGITTGAVSRPCTTSDGIIHRGGTFRNPQMHIGQAAQQLLTAIQKRRAQAGSSEEEVQWNNQLMESIREQFNGTNLPDPQRLNQLYTLLSTTPDNRAAYDIHLFRNAFVEWAKELPLPSEQLLPSLRDFRPAFIPSSDFRLQESRMELFRTLKTLDRDLTKDAERGEISRQQLRLDEIALAMGPETTTDSSVVNTELMGEVLLSLQQISPEYRDERFRVLQDQVSRYLFQVRIKREPEAYREICDEVLNELQKTLEEDPQLTKPESSSVVTVAAQWLDTAEQAPWIVGGIRRSYGDRNFYLDASSDLVNRLVTRPVTWTGRVSEVIRGTQINGTATTQGNLTATTVASSSSIKIQLHFDGSNTANTVGVNGPATIHTSSSTYLIADKPIQVTESGIAAGATVVRAGTQSQINGISAGGVPLVQRIVQDRVSMEKRDAEYEASQRTAKRFSEEMQKQVVPILRDANGQYAKIRRQWTEWRIFPDQLAMMSDQAGLQVQGRFAAEGRLSPAQLPPVIQHTEDLTVRLHQSAINNLAATLFSGAELRKSNMNDFVQKLTFGHAPAIESNDSADWGITFYTDQDPIEVVFEGNRIHISINGASYDNGEHAIDGNGRSVRATYRIELRDGRIVLALEPESFSCPDLIRKKMRDMFRDVIELDDVTFTPEGGQTTVLRLVRLGTLDGWVTASWKLIRDTTEQPNASVATLPSPNSLASLQSEPMPELTERLAPVISVPLFSRMRQIASHPQDNAAEY